MEERKGELVSRPQAIRAWVEREFAAKWVEQVFQDLLDVATGARVGNKFEREALERIERDRLR